MTGMRRNRTRPGGYAKAAAKKQARGSVGAAEFKATCLDLMNRVRETGAEYVVTKHGEPVAKLVPYTGARARPFFGSLKGTVLELARPFDPVDGEYDLDRD